MRTATSLLLAFATVSAMGLASSAPADELIATVTSCDQIELNGNVYPRFTLRIHNPSPSQVATEIHLDRVALSTGPEDSCSWVGGEGPAGWQTVTFVSGKLIFVNLSVPIAPGGTLDDFRVVTTRACCFRVVLGNTEQSFALEQACLQCAIPASELTWGHVKVRYR